MAVTIQDLQADAASVGVRITDRTVNDWIARGLLAQRKRVSLGRGKGQDLGQWHDDQRKLFRMLLAQRRHVKNLAPVANIPVWLWLTGESDGIPVEQIRRAVRTWVKHYHRSSRDRNQQTARAVVNQFSHPSADRRTRKTAADKLAEAAYSGRLNSAAGAQGILAEIFDPMHEGRTAGAADAPLHPRAYSNLVQARLCAIEALNDFGENDFLEGRLRYQAMWAHYLRDRPRLQAEATSETVSLFNRPDLSEIVNSACEQLLTHLGLALMERTKEP